MFVTLYEISFETIRSARSMAGLELSHFMDGDVEACREDVACPKAHSEGGGTRLQLSSLFSLPSWSDAVPRPAFSPPAGPSPPRRAQLRLLTGHREQGSLTGLQMEAESLVAKASSHIYFQKSLG